MTDLPRFHTGEVGGLSFEHLNEAFRRLDLLRPLVEAAGVTTTRDPSGLPPIFPGEVWPIPDQADRYSWAEYAIDEEDVAFASGPAEEDADPVTYRRRYGGIPDPETGEVGDDYAILPTGIVVATKTPAVIFRTQKIDGKPIHLAIPRAIDGASLPAYATIESREADVTLPGTSRSAAVYQATRWAIEVDQEDPEVFTIVEGAPCKIYDLGISPLNAPLSETGASYSYHELEVGTAVFPTWAGRSGFISGPLRLDFSCG